MRLPLCLAVPALLVFLSAAALAQDLGAFGRTYPIKEPDMLALIKGRLQSKIDNGEYARYRDEAKERIRQRFLDPPAVDHLAPATENRTFFYDPTIVVGDAIRSPDGAAIVPAGTRINPLDYVPFQGKWVFVDGREPKQLVWAKAQLDEDSTARPIFIAGKWIDQWRAWQRRTYFDQGGALVQRLGISATPAVVTQEARRIRIDEIVVR